MPAADGPPEALAEPRSVSDIFADLRVVCHAPGALHAISTINYRDWFLVVDIHGNVTHNEDRRWSRSRLNGNELMLLVGLMVQSPTDKTISVVQHNNLLVETMDKLLEAFHDALTRAMRPDGDFQTADFDEKMGAFGREAIYYGANSAFIHQYKRFSRLRYKPDNEWLLQNAGLSIRPMIDIAKFIADRVNRQMTVSAKMAEKSGRIQDPGDLTNSLIVGKKDIVKCFGSKAEAFLKRFSTPITNANKCFVDPFSKNLANLAPLIDFEDFVYVCNQYRLFETIYESPFYWMLDDPAYKDAASVHRGQFLESTATHLLAKVFGEDNVHKNVVIHRSRQEIAAEADVLESFTL